MVLDASVALSWLYERSGSAEQAFARQVLTKLALEHAVVPALWQWEVANGVLVGERRQLTTPAEAADYLNRLVALPIEIDAIDSRIRLETTLALARQYALTSYDAAYLELAVRLDVPLATFDRALARAAAAVGLRYGG